MKCPPSLSFFLVTREVPPLPGCGKQKRKQNKIKFNNQHFCCTSFLLAKAEPGLYPGPGRERRARAVVSLMWAAGRASGGPRASPRPGPLRCAAVPAPPGSSTSLRAPSDSHVPEGVPGSGRDTRGREGFPTTAARLSPTPPRRGSETGGRSGARGSRGAPGRSQCPFSFE